MINLFRAMRTFICVVDEGSFAGAARALDISPAAVTRLVAELEQEIGARLLHRTTRRLAPTEAGLEYTDHVREILAKVAEASAAVESTSRVPTGPLRVGGAAPLLSHQIAPLLPEFRRRYPKVSFQLTALDPQSLGGLDESLDITLICTPAKLVTGDFVAHLLASTELIFCASPSYFEANGVPVYPADLAHHEVLVPNAHSTPRIIEFRRKGHPAGGDVHAVQAKTRRSGVLSSAHHETLHAAANAGMGILATLPWYVQSGLSNGTLVRVLQEWASLRFDLYAAIPSRNLVPPKTRAFMDFLREKIQSLDGK